MQFKKAVSNETALKSSMHTTGSYVQHAPKVRRLLLKSGKSCRFRQGSVPLVRGRPQAIAFALGCTARKHFWFVTMLIIEAAPDAVKLLEYALSCYGVTHLSEGTSRTAQKIPQLHAIFVQTGGISYLFSSEGSSSASWARKLSYASGVFRLTRMTFRSHSFKSSSLK